MVQRGPGQQPVVVIIVGGGGVSLTVPWKDELDRDKFPLVYVVGGIVVLGLLR